MRILLFILIVVSFIIIQPLFIPKPVDAQMVKVIKDSYIIKLKPSFVNGNPERSLFFHAKSEQQMKEEQINEVVSFYNESNDSVLSRTGGEIVHVYNHTGGFSVYDAKPEAIEQIKNDPTVEKVSPNTMKYKQAEYFPTGIVRIGMLQTATTAYRPDGKESNLNVDIAVDDGPVSPTGFGLPSFVKETHPDLNIYRKLNFEPAADTTLDIHGTHVAGICCAKDNLGGVVGVAQGARIWSLRICGSVGCSDDAQIAALNYIIAHASEIEVANFSIGGLSGSASLANNDPTKDSYDAAVAAGVVVVAAAGNEASDATSKGAIPCSFPSVICVSALTDYDGKCGGLVGTSPPTDDLRRTTSNWGTVVDIMAPGGQILSTWPGQEHAIKSLTLPTDIGSSVFGTYSSISGTSMASPHVAGLAALYKLSHPTWTPAQVKSGMQADAYAQTTTCNLSTNEQKGGLVSGANSLSSEKIAWAGNL